MGEPEIPAEEAAAPPRDESVPPRDEPPFSAPGPGHGHHCLDWCPICRGAEMLRAAVPPELQAQFQLVQRDALLMAQAMIAAQLQRMQEPQPEKRSATGDDDPGVESIPLD